MDCDRSINKGFDISQFNVNMKTKLTAECEHNQIWLNQHAHCEIVFKVIIQEENIFKTQDKVNNKIQNVEGIESDEPG